MSNVALFQYPTNSGRRYTEIVLFKEEITAFVEACCGPVLNEFHQPGDGGIIEDRRTPIPRVILVETKLLITFLVFVLLR